MLYRLYEVLVVYGVSPSLQIPKHTLTPLQYSYKALIAEKVIPFSPFQHKKTLIANPL